MSPSELEELLYREPFQPLRLTLSSGDQIVVREEDKPMVSNLALILRGTPHAWAHSNWTPAGFAAEHRVG
jgi:hypothetical protein